MAPHVSHIGVHDHGFNNLSTYGNLRRLMLEGRIGFDQQELDFYELAIKVSGAVQAARWTETAAGTGFIHSFNGPHSLFSDTMRSLRILVLADKLGHALMSEGDRTISLLGRAIEHALTTARFNVYYGEGRDIYDVPGRVAHESIFNTKDGNYRCASSQQGYTPFSTWTRGLAWVLTGYAEQLEFLRTAKAGDIDPFVSKRRLVSIMEKAAISGQGYLRLGNYLLAKGDRRNGNRYRAAALTIAAALLEEPYLSTNPRHQGLTLHSVYHQPNGWDFVPKGRKIPCGESSMWGDYHAMELLHLVKREAEGGTYPVFFA